MKAYIFPNLDKQNCLEYAVSACEILHNSGAEISLSDKYARYFSHLDYIIFGNEIELIKRCDIIVVVGGDGTILRCADIAAIYSKPVLGVNCGRLGFMAALEHTELDLLTELNKHNYTNSHRMMIKVCVMKGGKQIAKFEALNDIVISKCEGSKIADFEVSKNGQIISSLRADGIIFSTPTGATAYSMSAGGPIIEPEMDCIEFTHICPHSLFARTMVLSDSSVLNIKFHANGDAMTTVIVDGNSAYKLSPEEELVVSKSNLSINLIDIQGGSFFKSINRKLMKPFKEVDYGDSYEK